MTITVAISFGTRPGADHDVRQLLAAVGRLPGGQRALMLLFIKGRKQCEISEIGDVPGARSGRAYTPPAINCWRCFRNVSIRSPDTFYRTSTVMRLVFIRSMHPADRSLEERLQYTSRIDIDHLLLALCMPLRHLAARRSLDLTRRGGILSGFVEDHFAAFGMQSPVFRVFTLLSD